MAPEPLCLGATAWSPTRRHLGKGPPGNTGALQGVTVGITPGIPSVFLISGLFTKFGWACLGKVSEFLEVREHLRFLHSGTGSPDLSDLATYDPLTPNDVSGTPPAPITWANRNIRKDIA